jgi:hypothetical protein
MSVGDLQTGKNVEMYYSLDRSIKLLLADICFHSDGARWPYKNVYCELCQSNSCKYATDFLVNFLCVSYYHAPFPTSQ